MGFTLKIGGVYRTYGGSYKIKFKNKNNVTIITILDDDKVIEQFLPEGQVMVTYHAEQ